MAASFLTLYDTNRILKTARPDKDGTDKNIYLPEEIFKPIDNITLALVANGPITHQALLSLFDIFWSAKTLRDSLERLEHKHYICKKSISGQVIWYYGVSLIRKLDGHDKSAKLRKPDINASNFTEIDMRSRLFIGYIYKTLAQKERERITKEQTMRTAYIYKVLIPRFHSGSNKEKRRIIQNWGFDQNTYDKVFNTKRFKYGDKITNIFIQAALAHWMDTEDYTDFKNKILDKLNNNDPTITAIFLKWIYTDKKEQMDVISKAISTDAMSYCLRNWNGVLYYVNNHNERVKRLREYDRNRRKINSLSATLYCLCNKNATEQERKAQEVLESLREANKKIRPSISYTDGFNNVRPFSLDTLKDGRIYVKEIDYDTQKITLDILDCTTAGFTLASLYDKLALIFAFCSYIGGTQYSFTADITIYTTTTERVKYLEKAIEKVMATNRSDKRPRLDTMINSAGKAPNVTASLLPAMTTL